MGASDYDDYFGLQGKCLHDKYRVEQAIGEGGFGVVYRAFHLRLHQPVAIKCLKIPRHFTKRASSILLEHFQAEGRHLAKLSQHASITQVYDFAVAEGTDGEPIPYLVLEWLAGCDLEALLREGAGGEGVFGESEALRLLHDAIDAIAFAHEHGIAHRDIKPSNFFLAETPRGRVVKLLDFGIAKLMLDGERTTRAATKTSSGFSAFTPGYAAPEQFRSEKFGETGPWTDVHALGLVLVEMVCARPALAGDNGVELYQSCMAPDRPTPRRRGGEVSDAFEQLCERALALDPQHRFPNAKALLIAAETIYPQRSAARTLLDEGVVVSPVLPPPSRPRVSKTLPDSLEAPAPVQSTLPDLPASAQADLSMQGGRWPGGEHAGEHAGEHGGPTRSSGRGWGALMVLVLGAAVFGAGAVAVVFGPRVLETSTSSSDAIDDDAEPEDDDADGRDGRTRTRVDNRRRATPPPPPRPSRPAVPAAACRELRGCERACLRKDLHSCEQLVALVDNVKTRPGDPREDLRLSKLACDAGSPKGCALQGVVLTYGRKSRNGKRALSAKPKEGVPLLEKACGMGAESGCLNAGHYHRGSGVAARGAVVAEHYYRKGCLELRHHHCCEGAADLVRGMGNKPEQLRRVRNYQERANLYGCQAGHLSYCARVGKKRRGQPSPSPEASKSHRGGGRPPTKKKKVHGGEQKR